MSKEESIDQFVAYLETLGLDTATLQMLPEETITVAENFAVAVRKDPLHTLPELRLEGDDNGESPADLRVVRTLGEGGMGLVRLASQVSLDREVAVKTLKEGKGEAAARSLLQEAYMTGYVEHPNIIPIYTIGRTSDGAPLIVMKRVEGTSWLKLIEAEDGDRSSEIATHIEILIQVSNAVRFAHSRGVIHRDIKAENVMIGHFDEVYLLDWGIAASLGDEKPLLARVADTSGICGTPCYMAPEMARQHNEEVDERTDVYLLGATLHHVLTGQPRHGGQDVLQVLFAASQSEPYDYSKGVPVELAQIANKACHREKKQRFSTVDEFREALEDYLRHRESNSLGVSADEKRQELIQLLQGDDPELRSVLHTYGECRFGFYQSLRMWPDNSRAIDGLQSCLETMAEFYLGQENIDAARECIAELPEPRPDLEARADELARRIDEKQKDLQRLKRLESNLDLSKGSSGRSLLMLLIGVLWTATSGYSAYQLSSGAITPAEDLVNHMTSGFRNIGVVVLAMFIFRKYVFANVANRRLVYLMMAMVLVVAFLRWSAWYLDADLTLARTADSVVYVIILIAVGLISDLRIALFAIYFAAAAVVGVIWPDVLLYASTAATALTFASFAWIWSPARMNRKIAF